MLYTTTVTIAGLSLAGAKDDEGNYYVCVPELEKALGWHSSSTREKLRSESLKAFTDKEIQPVKKKANTRGFVTLLSTKDFSILLGWQASLSNKAALSLLIACTVEAVERRIDTALGIQKSETEYEQNTREFYRHLAREAFRPMLTDNLQKAARVSGLEVNYGQMVNVVKAAIGVPCKAVDEYNERQIMDYYNGITKFGVWADEGYTVKQILDKLKAKAAPGVSIR